MCALAASRAGAAPLASWNDGPAKTRIVSFVQAVTAKGGADFVAPAERIAVFDNDGTLWAEQPSYSTHMTAGASAYTLTSTSSLSVTRGR